MVSDKYQVRTERGGLTIICACSVSVSRILYMFSKYITNVIISMTKLLDADWLRGVQLFH
jgi:hypothetical protein